ncbi:MAG: hypothetical protein GTO31_01090, partial [Xanthomonadales bacterium]|nr:hypothetical protein [Xanthomonadales bacterium]
PPDSRTLFHFLCCLEEADRQSGIVQAVWPHLWQRLEQPGEAPDLATTLVPLTAAGLVEVRPLEEEGEETGFLYNLHPGVAEAGRTEAGDDFQAAVDAQLAAFWRAVFDHGLKEEMHGGGRLLVQAGRGATPYLLRQHRSLEAYLLLDKVIQREQSPRMVATILPLLRHTVTATEGTDLELLTAGMLATALLKAGRWLEAEAMMRDIVRLAAERGE